MKKTFCDICGGEITHHNKPSGGKSGRLGTKLKKGKKVFRLEVLVEESGQSNIGDLCRSCIAGAFSKMAG